MSEDNKMNQMLIVMLLEEFGVIYDIANKGKKTYRWKYARFGGVDSMLKIRERYKSKYTSIIPLPANAMAEDKERFLTLGMNDYILKPIDENELYITIKKFW